MKKKVIALVVDTDLTNEQLEEWDVLLWVQDPNNEARTTKLAVRNVRVLDSDEASS